MPRKHHTGQCVYCGTHGHVTSDHVPPKCLFPPNDRVNLITVNACATCHDGFKLDDEYFRVALSVRADLPEGPEAVFLREQTKRTLRNPVAKQFRAAIGRATTHISIRSKGGTVMGDLMAIKLNPIRITRTAERIVRGLYAKHFEKPLPDTHEVFVSILDFQKDDSVLEQSDTREILILLGQYGKRRLFGKTLDLWYAAVDDDPNSSVWWVRLHGIFGFIGFTLPRADRGSRIESPTRVRIS